MFSTIIRVISNLSTITLKLPRITHFPKTIFYISISLIITVLLNDAIRFCSKMSLSGDSCHTETCRARRSTGVRAMGVFTARRYRTDKRSKIFLLFELLFFIKTSYIKKLSFCLNYNCSRDFFFLLEMLVNVKQYGAAIGVFNNRSFITIKKSFYATETNSVRKMSLPFLAINVEVLFFFFFFMLTASFHQKYRKNRFMYCFF